MAFYFTNNPFDYQRPTRIYDQHFGLVLEPEDMVAPLLSRDIHSMLRGPAGYLRPWRSQVSARDAGSTVSMDRDQFKVNLDVQQFKPEEISVKAAANGTVTIEGKHEEKQDEHGHVSRHFVRKYVLPKGHDMSKVESKLSSDGVLTVTAPRMAVAGEEAARKVPITQTGEAFKAVMEKRAGEQKKVEAKQQQKTVEKATSPDKEQEMKQAQKEVVKEAQKEQMMMIEAKKEETKKPKKEEAEEAKKEEKERKNEVPEGPNCLLPKRADS